MTPFEFARLSFADLHAIQSYALDISKSYAECQRNDISLEDSQRLSQFFLAVSTGASAELERRMTEKFGTPKRLSTDVYRENEQRLKDYMESKL